MYKKAVYCTNCKTFHSLKSGCYKGEMTMPSGQETLIGGIKHDETKRRMDLVPTSLISAVARILEFGAGKYGDNNWRKGFKWGRVYAALQRHLTSFWSGKDLDDESKLPHLYHAACNIAFLIEFYEKRKDLDDRYKDPIVFSYNSKIGGQFIPEPGALDNLAEAASFYQNWRKNK